MDDDAPRRRPKYLAPDFMAREIALFHQARAATRAMRRYGDNDAPVPAVRPIAGIRSIRPIRGIGGIDVDV